ncbi:MAG: protein kinase domain-containing protein, partial [Planctomycetota bacterium]
GGTTADGRPYIVMEHVQGRPLTEHADRAELSFDQRLELFGQVCAAVQFAHRNLVVHRDLKPANILVTEGGTVKLLDFGVCKLLEPGHADGSDLTATLPAPMTLRYASPEQLLGGAVTTATDVYALGVVLFELLTGTLPYDTGRSLHEALVAIRDTEPPRPSTRNPALNGELDAIVLHALAKEPERRYPTVAALADDVQRHRAGRTVLAHPPARLYLVRKAAWRYRWPLALAASVGLALAAITIVATVLSLRLARERDAAVAAERREAVARGSAERLNAFLADTLIDADPLADGRPGLSVLQLLRDAEQRLEADRTMDGASRAALHLTLGRAMLNLWLVRDAQHHLEAAIAGLRRHDGRDGALADALQSMGQVHLFLFEQPAAVRACRESLALHRRLGDRLAIATACFDLAGALRDPDDAAEARRLLREAIEIRRAALGDDHVAVAEAIEALAARQDDPDEARALSSRATAIRRRADGADLADGLEAAAALEQQLGDRERATALYRAALDERVAGQGPRHPATIEPRLHAGVLIARHGDRETADRMLEDAVTIAAESLPPWHRTARYARSIRGLFLAESGRPAEAEPHLLAAYEGTVRMWGAEHLLAAHLCVHLSALYDATGRTADAQRYREAAGERRSGYVADEHGCCPACGFLLRPPVTAPDGDGQSRRSDVAVSSPSVLPFSTAGTPSASQTGAGASLR